MYSVEMLRRYTNSIALKGFIRVTITPIIFLNSLIVLLSIKPLSLLTI